jgi:hypothetical protein
MPLGSKANIKAGDVAKGIKNHKGLVILDRNGTQLYRWDPGRPGVSRLMGLRFERKDVDKAAANLLKVVRRRGGARPTSFSRKGVRKTWIPAKSAT